LRFERVGETELGEFFADIFVENCLVVEVKACRKLVNEHVAQLLGYLKSCRRETGLLINFGASKLQIKKYLYSPDLSEGSCGQQIRL